MRRFSVGASEGSRDSGSWWLEWFDGRSGLCSGRGDEAIGVDGLLIACRPCLRPHRISRALAARLAATILMVLCSVGLQR